MRCRWYGRPVLRGGPGLLACAALVLALAAAPPAAAAGHPRESHRDRGASAGRDEARPALSASSPVSNRGTQQVSVNVANEGIGIQNALCRGSRACDIAQVLAPPSGEDPPAGRTAPRALSRPKTMARRAAHALTHPAARTVSRTPARAGRRLSRVSG
ncbi:hypothetical protein [Microbispora triticiradicis]|uniref:hypothetical protein n=1 Tax=Microbispora triticiradicis TaxID=2200763 RepID=UPI001AD7E220|nr:hypothetical protein [Microbispora triticiradicis]MBO4270449.1 hypothetical protein [Microbispora triticiradicis]